MNNNQHIPVADPENASGALSVYQNGADEEFPVLKAFQQYIDAEHAKSRKRVLTLCGFFGFVLVIVISVFVMLLLKKEDDIRQINADGQQRYREMSERNQELNDRLVELALKERVEKNVIHSQPPQQQDPAALLSLTEKIADLQKQLSESQAKAAKAEEEAAKAKQGPTAEEKEIARLKAELKAAHDQAAADKAKQREAELEAYRRKHYPELYAPQPAAAPANSVRRLRLPPVKFPADDEAVLDDDEAISYFDDDDEDEVEEKPSRKAKKTQRKAKAKTSKPVETKTVEDKRAEMKSTETKVETKTEDATPAKALSAEEEKKATGGWQIPED